MVERQVGGVEMTGQAAWADLVAQHGPRLFGLAAHILRNRDEAEDIVQETFVKAYVAIVKRGLEVHTSMRAWLSRIALNLCYDRLRREGRWEMPAGLGVELVGPGAERSGSDGPTQHEPGPEEAVLRLESSAELSKELLGLPPNHRAAVLLRYGLDLSYREMAMVLGVPESTVATWLHRAHLALRHRLESARDDATREEESVACRVTAHA